jgi:uncharacterized UBP type Zn finger protein
MPKTPCTHLAEVQPVSPKTRGCEECLQTGTRWVKLRMCLTCGHVGCCDSSPGKHATEHFNGTHHAVMRSAEPGEAWGWCYVDRTMLAPEDLALAPPASGAPA